MSRGIAISDAIDVVRYTTEEKMSDAWKGSQSLRSGDGANIK